MKNSPVVNSVIAMAFALFSGGFLHMAGAPLWGVAAIVLNIFYTYSSELNTSDKIDRLRTEILIKE